MKVSLPEMLVNLVTNANDAVDEDREEYDRDQGLRASAAASWRSIPKRQLSLFDGRYRRRRVFGQLDPDGDYARIDVTDNGKGMSSRVVPRIFDPFYTNKRATPAGQRPRPGGGSFDHRFLRRRPLSRYRRRTRDDVLDLPAAAQQRRCGWRARADKPRHEGTERVLIVDDDVDVADMMSIGLARLGYEVAVSNDPLEALEAFTEEPQGWDVAVIDRMMPEMDGVELAMMLKAIRERSTALSCAPASMTAPSSRSEDELQVVISFFVKPASPDQIAGGIRDLFDRMGY